MNGEIGTENLCFEGAGYTPPEIATIKQEVDHFEKACTEVKLASGDYIDLKMYEPAMRHLIDTYIRAEESENISAFDDLSLIRNWRVWSSYRFMISRSPSST